MTIQELKERIEFLNEDLTTNLSNLDRLQSDQKIIDSKISKCILNIQKDVLRLKISTEMLFRELPMDKLPDLKKERAKEKLFGGRV